MSELFPNNCYSDNYHLLKTVPIEGEVFKTLVYPDCEICEFFEISNYGRIRSIPRQIKKGNRWDASSYYQTFGGNILSVRDNGKQNILFSTIAVMHPETKKHKSKSIYIGKAVAHTFKTPSKDPKKNKVNWKDGNYYNNFTANLEWKSQSYFSKLNMERATEERRNAMGLYNQKKANVNNTNIENFYKYLDEGKSVKAAYIEAGISAGSAYYHYRKKHPNLVQRRDIIKRATPEEVESFFKILDEEGKSVQDAAELAGITRNCAYYQVDKRRKKRLK